MEYKDIKGAEVIGYVGNGKLASGELCYQCIEIKIDGKLYEIKQTPTKHPVMYLRELPSF